MTIIHVEFFDHTLDPKGTRAGAEPSMGMPDSWLDALIGDGHVEQRDYVAPGVLKSITARFPTHAHREQFTSAVREVSKLVGTRAVVHGDRTW
ncbi:hypothetical protein G3N95_15120 [Paraburkholderia sp. Tr-20389]|uniref:hypothetical protein n=1 Tax=Paraburkholderia sp. Tr-20389 TaxID=2703903 RepID=UPI001980546D|nr:hypothetical protein [Paraburkholderia sp. Tr-20389]MBN3754282.1 hypothetical protein [Paraburkholderia sp. Tr-20389]